MKNELKLLPPESNIETKKVLPRSYANDYLNYDEIEEIKGSDRDKKELRTKYSKLYHKNHLNDSDVN